MNVCIYLFTVSKNTATPPSAPLVLYLNYFTCLWLLLFSSGDKFLAARCGVCGIFVIFWLYNCQCGTFCRVANTYVYIREHMPLSGLRIFLYTLILKHRG